MFPHIGFCSAILLRLINEIEIPKGSDAHLAFHSVVQRTAPGTFTDRFERLLVPYIHNACFTFLDTQQASDPKSE